MVLLEEKIYKKTKKILHRNKGLSPMFKEFSMWLYEKYSITAINFDYSELEFSKDRYRFQIILSNTTDYKKMHINTFEINPQYQKEIKIEFSRLCMEYKYSNEEKLSNLLIIFNDFSKEAKTEANWKASDKADRYLKKKYCDVPIWYILPMFTSTVVFYLSSNDVQSNNENGLSLKIKRDYFEILKKYDEFNYYTFDNFDMTFDSKENIDNNYQGNIFYYTR